MEHLTDYSWPLPLDYVPLGLLFFYVCPVFSKPSCHTSIVIEVAVQWEALAAEPIISQTNVP